MFSAELQRPAGWCEAGYVDSRIHPGVAARNDSRVGRVRPIQRLVF